MEGWGDAHPPDVVIWPEFPLGDAVMTLDGYDIEICPASALLPAVVFLLAAVMSFSVGTSWGTMGIMMPICIDLACRLTGLEAGGEPGSIVIATIGAVLAGAVFGDHCSPISDTTIVSAFASGCDAIEHVRTQLPYALIAGGVAVVLGYAPAGAGVNPFLLLIGGGVACWALIRFVGKRA